MRILLGLVFFLQKIIISSILFSTLLSAVVLPFQGLFKGIGIAFIFLTPFFHYFLYEVRTPNEYYFYYNLGLSKGFLWGCTIGLSISVGFFFYLI